MLEKKVFVYALSTLALLRTIDTPENPKGVAALSPCAEPCLLALPASLSSGMLRVYDLMVCVKMTRGHLVDECVGVLCVKKVWQLVRHAVCV